MKINEIKAIFFSSLLLFAALFISPGASLSADDYDYDYHLRLISSSIDAGDPASDYSLEPPPNGGRINQGGYGNTPEAALSYPDLLDDSDGDGMPNWYEIENGLDPDDPADGGGVRQLVLDYMGAHGIELPPGFNPALYPFAGLTEVNDPDGDGLTNLEEYLLETDPRNPDSDGDGIPDGWEVLNNLDPLDSADARQDADEDGASNYEEFISETDPNDPDSVFSVTDIDRAEPGRVTITWNSVTGLSYDIYFSDDPPASGMTWTLAVEEYPSQGAVTSWTDDGTETGSPPTSARRYQVSIHNAEVLADNPENEGFWSVARSENFALTGGRMNMGGERRPGGRFLNVDSIGDSVGGVLAGLNYRVWSGMIASIYIDTTPPEVELDSDNDGLPDWWEIAHGLDPYNPWGADGPNGDPDGDGMTNREEYISGTDPNDPDSVFEVIDVDRTEPGSVTVTWSSVTGLYYDIYFTDEPIRSDTRWALVVSDYPSQGAVTSWTDDGSLTGSPPTPSRNYRITISGYLNPSILTEEVEFWWQMSSSSFALNGGSLNMGGDGRNSASFTAFDLIGETAAGRAGNRSFGLEGGSLAGSLSDNDGDGLLDSEEIYLHGTDPDSWDTDGDGMSDGWEILNSLDPLDPADAGEDPDSDDYTNLEEYLGNSDPHDPESIPEDPEPPVPPYLPQMVSESYAVSHGITNQGGWTRNALDRLVGDSIGDVAGVVSSGASFIFNGGALASGLADSDGDGLLDTEEIYRHGTNPNLWDTDGDGMPDGWEAGYYDPPAWTSPDPLIADADADPDGDSYTNLQEYSGGSDPTDPESIPGPPVPSPTPLPPPVPSVTPPPTPVPTATAPPTATPTPYITTPTPRISPTPSIAVPTITPSPTPTPHISAPTGLELFSGPDYLELSWNANPEPDILGYHIYRSQSAEEGYDLIVPGPWGGTDYADYDILPGEVYYYQVSALNLDLFEGARSDYVRGVAGAITAWMPDYRGWPEDEVILLINATNAAGISNYGLDVQVTYDPDLLTPLAQVDPERPTVEKTALTSGFMIADNGEIAEGQLNISGVGLEGMTVVGEGHLFHVKFVVAAEAAPLDSCEHIFVTVRFKDAEGEDLPVDYSSRAVFTVAEDYILGDLNGDGVVDSGDALIALRISVGEVIPSDLQRLAGDLNGDMKIDAADAVMILRKAVGLPLNPPQEAPLGFGRLETGNDYMMSLPDKYALPGETISVSLAIDRTEWLAGLDCGLFYNPDLLSCLGVVRTALTEDFSLVSNDQEGYLNLALSSQEKLTEGAGDLLVFSFRISPEAVIGDWGEIWLSDVKLSGEYGEDLGWYVAVLAESGIVRVGYSPSPTPTTTPTAIPTVTPTITTFPTSTPTPTPAVIKCFQAMGRVIDLNTGRGLPASSVRAVCRDFQGKPVAVSSSGEYELEICTRFEDGTVRVEARAAGYLPGYVDASYLNWADEGVVEMGDIELKAESIHSVSIVSGDYDGDGTSDIAIFRPTTGLWALRELSRVYFGREGDLLVPADYDGDGVSDIAIFRPASGLWAIRGLTRVYFGTFADIPVPGDYRGDGTAKIAIFRNASGLWAIRAFTRAYFGGRYDQPAPGDYTGDGNWNQAVFRSSTGMWALKGVSRFYYGRDGDLAVPGDYDGRGYRVGGIFRPASGLWAIRNVTRVYFGRSGDYPVPADYRGSWVDGFGIFRPSSGLWAIRGITRPYFGKSGDIPATR